MPGEPNGIPGGRQSLGCWPLLEQPLDCCGGHVTLDHIPVNLSRMKRGQILRHANTGL